MMNPMRVALLLSLASVTTAHDYDLLNDPDRYAHPRSVEEYRRIVPEEADIYGMCRSAAHLRECLYALHHPEEAPAPGGGDTRGQ